MGALHRGLAAGLAVGLLALAPSAVAAPDDDLTIDHVQPAGDDGELHLLVSVPTGATLDDLTVLIDGEEVETEAQLVADAGTDVRRTTVLAIDTSDSMRGPRFAAAQAAATQFLDGGVPDDVYVGIVTFDGKVRTALAPTTDRAAALAVVDGLELSRGTLLYDGVVAAAELTGSEGQRNVLLLSDGANTNKTTLASTTEFLADSGVRLDAVSLDEAGTSLAALEGLAGATDGAVIPADPAALAAAFEAEADALAGQVEVTAELPSTLEDEQAEVEVRLAAGGQTLTATTVTLVQQEKDPGQASVGSREEESSSFDIPRGAMIGGLAAVGVGLLLLLGMLSSMAGGTPKTVEQRIAAYGTSPVAAGKRKGEANSFNLEEMKGAAATMLHRNKGLEARIEARLEGAGSSFKSPEWLLLHGAIALIGAVVGVLLGNGSALTTIVGLLLGLALPWWWLGFKRKRRQAAFNSGLADTLQLIAGSLQAGMSLAQGLDSVVNEGNEPIAGEFKRVLIETRLGVPLETALEGISQRLNSVDFGWVVMAIRIQREVGGNLAELLTTVAGTLRERDYLRRQVQTLSAEGKLSAYILIALPIGLLGFLILARGEYVKPMLTEPLGWMLFAGAGVLMLIGGFMMSRIVKVEV